MARRRGQLVSDTTETTTAAPSEACFDEEVARDLLARARREGVSLVGPGGLLAGLTKTVLETALEAELTEHLATRSTTRRAGMGRTPVTGPGPRR